MPSALFGLVLAGGASTRMQRDKAALAYHGRPQLDWAYELLSEVCAATFVSVRPDQRDEATRAQYPQIVDRQPGTGPIAGISAALQEHPKAAWLVVACDLPFLTRETLQHLIANRDPQRVATAYRSSHDALPEPLCAIWEPSAREALQAYMQLGKQCPRKFLIDSNALLLDLPDAKALDNVNTAAEFSAASAALQSTLTRAGARPLPGGRGEEQGSSDPTAERESGSTPPPESASDGASLPEHASSNASLPERASGSAPPPESASDGASLPERASSNASLRERASGSAPLPKSASGSTPLFERAGDSAPLTPSPLAGEGRGEGGAARRTIALKIQYYALLREQAGRSEEVLDTSAATPAEVYRELQARHPFKLAPEQLKVAINAEFSDWHTALRSGDTVVFIPPVAGG